MGNKHGYDTLPLHGEHRSAMNRTKRTLSKNSTFLFLKMMRWRNMTWGKKLEKPRLQLFMVSCLHWGKWKGFNNTTDFLCFANTFGFPITYTYKVAIDVITVNSMEGPSVPTPNFHWTRAFFRTYCPRNMCLSDIVSWAGLLWTITCIVTLACKVPALWNVFKIRSEGMTWVIISWCHGSMQMSACALSVNDAHDSVQGPTSQPSGMISKLPEPRKQCHGCDLCVCGMHCSGQGYSSPFWGRICGGRFMHFESEYTVAWIAVAIMVGKLVLGWNKILFSEHQHMTHVFEQ